MQSTAMALHHGRALYEDRAAGHTHGTNLSWHLDSWSSVCECGCVVRSLISLFVYLRWLRGWPFWPLVGGVHVCVGVELGQVPFFVACASAQHRGSVTSVSVMWRVGFCSAMRDGACALLCCVFV